MPGPMSGRYQKRVAAGLQVLEIGAARHQPRQRPQQPVALGRQNGSPRRRHIAARLDFDGNQPAPAPRQQVDFPERRAQIAPEQPIALQPQPKHGQPFTEASSAIGGAATLSAGAQYFTLLSSCMFCALNYAFILLFNTNFLIH